MLAHELLAFAVPDRDFSVPQRLATVKPSSLSVDGSVPRCLVVSGLAVTVRLRDALGSNWVWPSRDVCIRPTSSIDSIIPKLARCRRRPLPIHHTILETPVILPDVAKYLAFRREANSRCSLVDGIRRNSRQRGNWITINTEATR
jgi:hypothetical protein